MRTLLCLALFLGIARSLTCPPQYNLMEGRCIRVLVVDETIRLGDNLPSYRSECSKDGATLPIIRDAEANDEFNRIGLAIQASNVWLVLDQVCNQTTRRVTWIDGSPIEWWPATNWEFFFDYDCVTDNKIAASDAVNEDWTYFDLSVGEPSTILCVIESDEPPKPTTTNTTTTPSTTAKLTTVTSKTSTTTTVPPTTQAEADQCGDYSMMSSPADERKPCIKVFTNPLPWEQAQQRCSADFGSLITISSAEENKYFWRTAISNGILEDMHIGAHQSLGNSTAWTWSDGEVPIEGGVYNNFFESFPVPGAGECAAMLTESSAAKWINEPCTDNPLPFICRRADFTTLPKNCPDATPPAGEDIFLPGFPDSSTGCEYLLFVGANQLVELEVMTLVADDNRDFLEIFEGPAGPNLIANLTGTILTSTKFTTTKSNVMRVNWQPFGTGSGRGFRMRYSEFDQ